MMKEKTILTRYDFTQPMALEQVVAEEDSEDEDDDVADLEDQRMLDDFIDVTQYEKHMMHLWNSFIRKQRVLADAHASWACEAYSDIHGEELVLNPKLNCSTQASFHYKPYHIELFKRTWSQLEGIISRVSWDASSSVMWSMDPDVMLENKFTHTFEMLLHRVILTLMMLMQDLMLPVVISYVNAAIDTTAIGFKRSPSCIFTLTACTLGLGPGCIFHFNCIAIGSVDHMVAALHCSERHGRSIPRTSFVSE
ncbi:polycomb group protein embryonic flower 2-like protein [Tanacetum coccineum]